MKAKDLAKQIGVSEATLSLVLNRKPGISVKTRARVTEQIRSLGYEHLLQAEEPAANGSKVLTFVLYKENGKLLGMNSFFPLILDGIQTAARKYGYLLNIVNIEGNFIDDQLRYIRESNCDGFIVFATEMHKNKIPHFESLNIPFVIFDNYFNDIAINCVKVNNEQGTYLAVKYLYEMGHRKIGYLSSGIDVDSFHERQNRAFEAMRSFGLTDCEKYLYTVGYPNEHAEEGMDQLLKVLSPEDLPTAFLADNDLVSIGAMQSLQKNGYRVPEDISMIGYDDRPVCTLVTPKLTTIQLPREKFGSASVDLLVQQIESPKSSVLTVAVNGILIERDSVAYLNNITKGE